MRLVKTLVASALLVSSTIGMGSYDQDWITRVRLPFAIINKMFTLLSLNPTGKDTSDALYAQLQAFETFETFIAV